MAVSLEMLQPAAAIFRDNRRIRTRQLALSLNKQRECWSHHSIRRIFKGVHQNGSSELHSEEPNREYNNFFHVVGTF
jgi:hypothetical protein